MSFRVRIYDAATEELAAVCDSADLGAALSKLLDRHLMMRQDDDGHLMGFACPTTAAITQVLQRNYNYQLGVKYGYRSVRPVDDDRSSV